MLNDWHDLIKYCRHWMSSGVIGEPIMYPSAYDAKQIMVYEKRHSA